MSSMTSGHFAEVPYFVHILVAIYMACILVMAVVGNGAVIWVFAKYRSLQNRANILVANLALSDLLMAVTSFPLIIISSLSGRWIFGQAVCDYYGATATCFSLMSINTLVFISLDRYIVIAKPNWGRQVPMWCCATIMVFIWAYSALWGLFPIFGFGRYFLEGFGTTCTVDYTVVDAPHKHLLLSMLILDFVVPLVAILLCYLGLYLEVRQHRQMYLSVLYVNGGSKLHPDEMPDDHERRPEALQTATEYRVARTILVVLSFFCITWTPYAVITMVAQYGSPRLTPPALTMIPCLFAKSSTIWNPVIYSLYHPRFRSKLRDCFPHLYSILELRFCRCCNRQTQSLFRMSTLRRIRLRRMRSGNTDTTCYSDVNIPKEAPEEIPLRFQDKDLETVPQTTLIVNYFGHMDEITKKKLIRSHTRAYAKCPNTVVIQESPTGLNVVSAGKDGFLGENSLSQVSDTSPTSDLTSDASSMVETPAARKRRRLSSNRGRKFRNKSPSSRSADTIFLNPQHDTQK